MTDLARPIDQERVQRLSTSMSMASMATIDELTRKNLLSTAAKHPGVLKEVADRLSTQLTAKTLFGSRAVDLEVMSLLSGSVQALTQTVISSLKQLPAQTDPGQLAALTLDRAVAFQRVMQSTLYPQVALAEPVRWHPDDVYLSRTYEQLLPEISKILGDDEPSEDGEMGLDLVRCSASFLLAYSRLTILEQASWKEATPIDS